MNTESTPLTSKNDKKLLTNINSYSSLSNIDSPSNSSYYEENNKEIMLTPPRYSIKDSLFWNFEWNKKKKLKNDGKKSKSRYSNSHSHHPIDMDNIKDSSLFYDNNNKRKKKYKKSKQYKNYEPMNEDSIIKSTHLYFNNKESMTDNNNYLDNILSDNNNEDIKLEVDKKLQNQSEEIDSKIYKYMENYQDLNWNHYIDRETESIDNNNTELSIKYKKKRKLNRIIPRKEINEINKLYIRKRIHKKIWWALYKSDWFHSIIDLPTYRLFFLIIFIYIFLVFFYAFIYFVANYFFECALDFKTFLNAFDFSLETMATIGYSTRDIFFNGCISVTLILVSQVITKLFIDGLLIGVIYSRLSRPHGREITIIFSKYATIRRIKGKLYFNFQICELRKNQLFNPQIKMYIVKKEINYDKIENQNILINSRINKKNPINHLKNAYFIQSSSMKIHHPCDSSLLLIVPQLIVHELDSASPLVPPPIWLPRTNYPPTQLDYSDFSDYSDISSVSDNSPSTPLLVPFQYTAAKKDENINDYTVSSINEDYYKSTSSTFGNISKARRLSNASISDLENNTISNNNKIYDLFYFSSNRLCEWYPPSYAQFNTKPLQMQSYNSFDSLPNSSLASAFPTGPSSPTSHSNYDNIFTSPSNYPPIPPSPSTSSLNIGTSSINQPYISPYSTYQSTIPNFFSPTSNSNTNYNNPVYLHSPGLEKYNSLFNSESLNLLNSPTESKSITNLSPPRWQIEEKEMIRGYLRDREVEIIVIVEGIDSTTGGNVQARFSYTYE